MMNNRLKSIKPAPAPADWAERKRKDRPEPKYSNLSNGQYGNNHREALIDRILAMPEPVVKKKGRK